tara:strand:+ start:9075 stop:9461 length:387 start_codon:yes stop_codon:yes gene_type:complete
MFIICELLEIDVTDPERDFPNVLQTMIPIKTQIGYISSGFPANITKRNQYVIASIRGSSTSHTYPKPAVLYLFLKVLCTNPKIRWRWCTNFRNESKGLEKNGVVGATGDNALCAVFGSPMVLLIQKFL